MSIFYHSSNLILSLKVVLISTAVLSMAVMLKFSVPAVTDFAISEVPSIWSVVASWLRPPYLYLVINIIIIALVASSKLQSKFDHHDSSFSPPPLETVIPVHSQQVKATPVDTRTDYAVAYGGEVLKSEFVEAPLPEFEYNGYAPKYVKASDIDVYGNVDIRVSENETKDTVSVKAPEEMLVDTSQTKVYETKNMISVNASEATDDFIISRSSWNSLQKDATEFSKPPVSTRFSHHRKVVRTTPEGGGKTLRVLSKPKRQDTLESTWKTITDGRAMPLTRHLKKSDTWETHGGNHRSINGDDIQDHKMVKYETFNDRGNSRLARSSGSGKLRKDPSLSQDELNKRVEAFINKFNEDMRLQRQESLNRYMEMINRGAH